MSKSAKTSSLNGQKGSGLIVALMALAAVTSILVPVTKWGGSSSQSANVQESAVLDRYASDSGVEHALWRVQYESGFEASLNPTMSYQETINGRTVNITVTAVSNPGPYPEFDITSSAGGATTNARAAQQSNIVILSWQAA